MSRADAERWLGLALSLSALLVTGTCSRAGRLEPAAAPRATARPASSAGAPAAKASASAVAVPGSGAPAPSSLARFYAALRALEQKTRKDHVRIVWFGDSHTAADFMTGAVRRRLELRFGVGGPGLIRIGASPYRHDGVKVTREGRWKVEPDPPSTRTPEGDAAFGIEGLRTLPADARARAEIDIEPRRVRGSVRYELLFDRPQGAGFRVTLGSQRKSVGAATPLESRGGSPIRRLTFEGPARDGFALDAMLGGPRFYGVIAEGSEAGVVLDTSGIDGARFATALAWDPAVLGAELAVRRPELVVIAYGTNEAFDNRHVSAYADELRELVERLRRGAAVFDCLVLAPPDAAAPDFTSLPRIAELEEVLARSADGLGCGFFSLRAGMGGDGGFARWLGESPPLARPDRIHLTVAGYERLGDAIADELIGGYDRAGGK